MVKFPVEKVPFAGCVPVDQDPLPPLLVHEVALVALHLMVVPEPLITDVLSAFMETSGTTGTGAGGAFTFTVTDWPCVVPPGPVQVKT